MSNRIVKHSSRYNGPAGASRPAAEIFAGIEAEHSRRNCIGTSYLPRWMRSWEKPI